MSLKWSSLFKDTRAKKYQEEAEAKAKKVERVALTGIEGKTLTCVQDTQLINEASQYYFQKLYDKYSSGGKAKGCEIQLDDPFPPRLSPLISDISIPHFFNYLAETMNSQLPGYARIRFTNKQIGYEKDEATGRKISPKIAPHFTLIVDAPKDEKEKEEFSETFGNILRRIKNG